MLKIRHAQPQAELEALNELGKCFIIQQFTFTSQFVTDNSVLKSYSTSTSYWLLCSCTNVGIIEIKLHRIGHG